MEENKFIHCTFRLHRTFACVVSTQNPLDQWKATVQIPCIPKKLTKNSKLNLLELFSPLFSLTNNMTAEYNIFQVSFLKTKINTFFLIDFEFFDNRQMKTYTSGSFPTTNFLHWAELHFRKISPDIFIKVLFGRNGKGFKITRTDFNQVLLSNENNFKVIFKLESFGKNSHDLTTIRLYRKEMTSPIFPLR